MTGRARAWIEHDRRWQAFYVDQGRTYQKECFTERGARRFLDRQIRRMDRRDATRQDVA